jgi:hypothetical protein
VIGALVGIETSAALAPPQRPSIIAKALPMFFMMPERNTAKKSSAIIELHLRVFGCHF